MRSRHTNRRVTKGFGLIEVLLVLAIAAIITALAIRQFHEQSETQEALTAAAGIVRLEDIANQLYANSLGYDQTYVTPTSTQPFTYNGSGATAPADMVTLYESQATWPTAFNVALPASGTPTDADFTSPWGGAVTVGTASTDGVTQDLLTITLASVPPDVCTTLLSILAPDQYSTTVNGNLVGLSPPPDAAGNGYTQVNWSQAGPLCNASTGNTIVFSVLKPLNFFNLRHPIVTPTLSPTEAAMLNPEYARVINAIAARNAAQGALP